MTSRDLGSVDSQLDALDPDGSLAARGRAVPESHARMSIHEADTALASLGVASPPRAIEPTRAAPAPQPPRPSTDTDMTLIPGGTQVPLRSTDGDSTFVPGSQPTPKLEPSSRAEGAPTWTKTAEPIRAADVVRKPDFGVDPNLDFDDLFEDDVVPTESAPLVVEPPAALSLEPRAEKPLPKPHSPDSDSDIDAALDDFFDEDELEIVLDE